MPTCIQTDLYRLWCHFEFRFVLLFVGFVLFCFLFFVAGLVFLFWFWFLFRFCLWFLFWFCVCFGFWFGFCFVFWVLFGDGLFCRASLLTRPAHCCIIAGGLRLSGLDVGFDGLEMNGRNYWYVILVLHLQFLCL